MQSIVSRAIAISSGSFTLRLRTLVLVLIVLASSCVPVRKVTYLQKDNDLKKQNPVDTVVRDYALKREPYRLQPEDIISIRVASVTEDQYNFIKKYEEDLGLIRKLDQYDPGSMRNQSGGANQNLARIGGGAGEGGLSAIALDRLNSGFVLDRNGELELPQIGVVQLAGLTIPEAEAKVKGLLEGYFETPMIRIQLLNFHFTILGEVEREGRYTSYDPETNVFDAITLSGNLTEFADRTNVKIIRKQGDSARIIYLNLLDEDVLAAQNYYLQKGDLIIVPALDVRTTNRYTIPNISRTLGIVSAAISLTALIISLSNRR